MNFLVSRLRFYTVLLWPHPEPLDRILSAIRGDVEALKKKKIFL